MTYTYAPIKLWYEVALTLHIQLAIQIKVDEIKTGRLPKQVCVGTLRNIGTYAEKQEWRAYQNRFEKPRTRIAVPTNSTTPLRSELNALM
jgi:hypothetical protein